MYCSILCWVHCGRIECIIFERMAVCAWRWSDAWQHGGNSITINI